MRDVLEVDWEDSRGGRLSKKGGVCGRRYAYDKLEKREEEKAGDARPHDGGLLGWWRLQRCGRRLRGRRSRWCASGVVGVSSGRSGDVDRF